MSDQKTQREKRYQEYLEHQNKRSINMIEREIKRYDTIKVPGYDIKLDSEDLLQKIEESVTGDELIQLANMIKLAKYRNSSLKPIFEIVAAGVINDSTY